MVLSQIGNKSVYYSALRQLEKLIVEGIYKPNEKTPFRKRYSATT